jgi:hypothetical protein
MMDDFAELAIIIAMVGLVALPVAMALAVIFGGWV